MRDLVHYRKQDLAKILLLAMAYFVMGLLSFSVSVEHDIITLVVFAAEGFSLAFVLRYGPNIWPGVFFGQLALALYNGLELVPSLGVSFVNSAEAVLAYFLFQRFKLNTELKRLRDYLGLAGLILFVLQPLSASSGVGVLLLTGHVEANAALLSWGSWWFGNSLGQLLFAPLLLRIDSLKASLPQIRQVLLALLAIAVVGALLVFGLELKNIFVFYALFMPLLIYLAVISNLVIVSTSLILVATLLLFAGSLGSGPLVVEEKALLNFNTMFLGLILTSQFVTVLFGELKGARNKLAQINENLEQQVYERTLEFSKAEERWVMALEGAGHGVWDWDANSDQVFFSHRWKTMLGYEDGDIGDGLEEWESRVHPYDLPRAKADLEKHLKGESAVYKSEHRLLCKDGSYKWVIAQGMVFESSVKGQPKRIVGTYTDITERKRAEEAQRNAYERFSAIMDSIDAGIYVADMETYEILFMNRYGLDNWGEDAVGKICWKTLQAGQNGPCSFCTNDQLLDTDGKSTGVYVWEFQNTAIQHWYHCRDLAIRWPDGRMVRMEIATDITDLKNMEAQLVEAKEMAEDANKAKSEFLSRMSHELRTPLNAILGFSEALKFDHADFSDDQNRIIKTINNAGTHLLDLINDVLDISRLEAGHVNLNDEAVSCDSLVDACMPLALSLAVQHNIELSLESPPSTKLFVRGDYTRLKEALINLLSNAIKYNCDGGAVILSYRTQDNGKIRFSVSDTGPGLTEEQQAKLFQPFQRLGAEHSDIEGTGIGLVIVKRLVELMGGEVGLDSEPGEGSTFWIELEETKMSDRDQIASKNTVVQPKGGQTVLYIEDNVINMQLVEYILKRKTDFRFLPATTPTVGLKLAFEHRPDLILLDIDLPDMDGYEVLERLQKNKQTCDVPVVAVSAHAMDKHIEKGLEAGFVEYITKPFSPANLLNVIEKILKEGD